MITKSKKLFLDKKHFNQIYNFIVSLSDKTLRGFLLQKIRSPPFRKFPVRALPVLPLRNLRHDLHHGIAGRRHRGLFPPLHRRGRMAVPRRKADQEDHYRHAACRGGRRRGLPRRRKLGSGVQSHSRQPADGRCRPVRDWLRRVRALHFTALLLPEHLSHSSARRDHRIPAFRVYDAHARQRHHARNRRPALYGPRRGFPRVSELQLRAQAS